LRSRSLAIERRGALAVMVLLVAGCGGADEQPGEATADAAQAEPLVVAATSPVAVWLVEVIGGDDVRISDAIPAEVDHHGFQPTAEQIVALGEADLIVVQGASYEPWRDGASLPESRVVDLSAGLSLIPVEGRTHSHGAEGEHSHTGVDPATWMDPALVTVQAQRVLAAPFLEREHALETELDRLAARLEELGGAIRAADVALAGDASRYSYLARALGVELLDLHDEPDDHDLGHLRRAVGSRRLFVLRPTRPDEALRAKLPNATWIELRAPLPAPGLAGWEYLDPLEAGLLRLRVPLSPGPHGL
jgi:zinc transport system substrate-binding protein